jgi:putative oxidoreductase
MTTAISTIDTVTAAETLTDGPYAQTLDTIRARLIAGETQVVKLLQRISLPLLRAAMSLVFLWFGALKVASVSPVGDLVANTLPFIDRYWLIPTMGMLEVALAVGLVVPRLRRIALPALIAHLSGTFLVLLVQPNVAFQQGNPLLLTTTGEFVVKNLVLISAAMVLLAKTGQVSVSGPAGRSWRSP